LICETSERKDVLETNIQFMAFPLSW